MSKSRSRKRKSNKQSSLLGDKSASSTPRSSKKDKKRNKSKNDDTKIEEVKSSWTMRQKLLYIGGIIAAIMGFIMLKQGEEQYGWSGLQRDSSEDDISFYEVLEIDSSSSLAQIKKAYRSLSLKYHPDRNPNCGKKCDLMTSKINKAYETLGDDKKRRIYDQTQGSISSIPSNSIELTYDNFDDYVTNSRGLFIIQVYAERYAECKTFSPIWEEAIEKFSGYVQFGRVHAANHISVVRRLGASIRDYPTVLSYVDGRYYRTYPAVRRPQKFFDFIHTDYPTRHLWKGDETKLNNIYHKWQSSDPKLPLIQVATKKLNPSLLVSWMAKKYDGVIKFVHLYPKPASKTHAKNTKQSSGRIRFLSNGLNKVFGVPKFVDFPKLITISAQGDAKVIEEKINKHNLKAFTRNYVQQLIPKFNSWSYTSVCGEHDIYCVLYTKGCNGRKKDKLRKYIKMAKKTVAQVKDIEESYYPKWVQFGYIDVMEEPLLRPLCANSNDTELIIVSEAQTLMTIADKKIDEYDDQILFEYIEMILNHEAETPTIDAPRIVPPPAPKKNVIDDVIEYFEELDYKDPDVQLNIIIITFLIALVFICKSGYFSLKGAVMTIFALSIFGGMLPTILGMLGGGGGGMPGMGQQQRRRRPRK